MSGGGIEAGPGRFIESHPSAADFVTLGRADAAQLCGRVSALSRAGVPPDRTWEVLALGRGPQARVAAIVAGMLAVGGTTAEGLRLAASTCEGPGVEALGWLATTAEVVQRSGAPAAAIFDGIGDGLLAQIAESDEREVALAGPRATARVLAALPLIGLLLGAVLGVNSLGVLFGTRPGLACLAAGLGLWWAGRAWTARLVRSVSEESRGRAS
ncbi:hypothetical protein KIH74_00430 [Kineosporia sp. J2-2]|uniref:Type II secretion system protein GspF domain-containing protein n=1 Tax=Kineosporia corallincola TaxID=2835133 RepID=A0ABS5T8G7_9ACTN|nr:hypothetical protein [Kineosporia corallincola]MBT0767365.1 hypothetical protein [Kineosporia corallincola]